MEIPDSVTPNAAGWSRQSRGHRWSRGQGRCGGCPWSRTGLSQGVPSAGPRLRPDAVTRTATQPSPEPQERTFLSLSVVTCIQTATRDSTHATVGRTKPHASTGCDAGTEQAPGRQAGTWVLLLRAASGLRDAHGQSHPGEIAPHTKAEPPNTAPWSSRQNRTKPAHLSPREPQESCLIREGDTESTALSAITLITRLRALGGAGWGSNYN